MNWWFLSHWEMNFEEFVVRSLRFSLQASVLLSWGRNDGCASWNVQGSLLDMEQFLARIPFSEKISLIGDISWVLYDLAILLFTLLSILIEYDVVKKRLIISAAYHIIMVKYIMIIAGHWLLPWTRNSKYHHPWSAGSFGWANSDPRGQRPWREVQNQVFVACS